MRNFFISAACLLVISASSEAQSIPRQQYLTSTYASNQAYVESAIETIEAINTIEYNTNVEYRAGQTVLLKPGFKVKLGATFTGCIKPVSDVQIQLMAFPNPYERSTTISFVLPKSGSVDLTIVDTQGKIMSRLIESSQLGVGQHQMEWNGSVLPAGVYMLMLQIDQQKISSRIVKK